MENPTYKCSNCEKQYKTDVWLKKHETKCFLKTCDCTASIELTEMKKRMNKLVMENNSIFVEFEILIAEMHIRNKLLESGSMEMIKATTIKEEFDKIVRNRAIEISNEKREKLVGKELANKSFELYLMLKNE